MLCLHGIYPLLIAESCYVATNSGDEERELAVLPAFINRTQEVCGWV